MTSTTHQHESTAAALDVACELSTKEWRLTLSSARDGGRQRARVRPGERAGITRVVAEAKARFGLAADAPVRSCSEAGREGFWPPRLLTTLGVSNLVVDSSSIEVSRRARRAKTDRRDGTQLRRMWRRYWGGERDLWHVVAVPTREAEAARHASRGLTTLTAERTRYRNRIQSLLALHGVRRVQTWRVLRSVESERPAARRSERQAVRATATPTVAQRLGRWRAIAARSATVLADELLARELRNRRQGGALTGLVSAPDASGTTRMDQGLARTGIPAVRRVAVEIAWAWRRSQPTSALSQWYHARFGGGGAVTRRSGIVALARRLLIALWRYVTDGGIPEGARLKA
jgi:transposase